MTKIVALGISGSPRKGNSEELLDFFLSEISSLGAEVKKIPLREFSFSGCISCRRCLTQGECCLSDDFKEKIVPELLKADVIVLATPVYFDNVSWLLKAFMDRTWCLRGMLSKKVGGGIAVGRGYGIDLALAAIHSWALKHEMILCHRGVRGIAFEKGEISQDERAKKNCRRMAFLLYEITKLLKERAIGGTFRSLRLLGGLVKDF